MWQLLQPMKLFLPSFDLRLLFLHSAARPVRAATALSIDPVSLTTRFLVGFAWLLLFSVVLCLLPCVSVCFPFTHAAYGHAGVSA